MSALSNAIAVVLVVACAASAVADFRRPASLLDTMARLKVPTDALATLGIIKIVAAAGLVAGLFVERLGQATGVALGVYFAIAVSTHVRVKDGARNTLPAFVLLVACMLFVITSIAA